MFRPIHLILSALFTICTVSLALGQEVKDASNKTQIITASVTPDGVRIAAPSAVVQLRLEVYDDAGQKLLDTEQRGGNVLDWHLQAGAGERVADGTYLCVVTIKNPSGRLSQKLGLVTVNAQSITLRPAGIAELSPRQAQVVGSIEGGDEALAVMPAEDAQPVAVLAHTGNEAQLTRTRGALSFRVGDFFSGNDKEQMRLTKDGRLGIGTRKPEATLDVAGTIRAERVVIAKPIARQDKLGSDNKVAADTAEAINAAPEESLVSGSGSQDRIAKWTDNSGTLGDSAITETAAGLVGIGTTSPNAKLTVSANTGIPPAAPLGVIANFVNADDTNTFLTADSYGSVFHSDFLFRKARGTMAVPTAVQADDIIGQIQARGFGATAFATSARASIRLTAAENWTDSAQGAYLTFQTTPRTTASIAEERMRITDVGNVGIGTTNPTARLDVAGDTKVSSNLTVDTNALFVDAANDRVGIGTATPNAGLNVRSAFNTRNAVLIENGNNAGGDEANSALWIKNTGLGGLVFRADDTASDTTPFIIDHSGNVGIGTTSPGSKLEVAGNIRLSGANSSLIFPDGTSMITAGGGSAPSGTNIVSAINDPVTAGTINDNRLSGNLAKLNVSNVYNGNQRVNGNVNINDQSNSGLRVQTSINGGTVASFGGFGNFEIDAPGVTGGRFAVKENGNVGIGTNTPTSRLQVAGTVESTAGGFKFPDGSVQPSAANPLVGKVYTSDPNVVPEVEINHDGFISHIISLNLPPGIYVVTATVQFENRANGLFQDNTRLVKCKLINEYLWHYRLGGANTAMDQITATMHTVLTHNVAGTVWLACGNLDSSGNVFAKARRFTAIRVADNPQ